MKVDYTALTGGLDLVTGAVSVRPGRLSECLNFEEVFGKVGYRRVDGYERFNGKPSPHKATLLLVDYTNGTDVFASDGGFVSGLGDTVAYIAKRFRGGGDPALGTDYGTLILSVVTGSIYLGLTMYNGALPAFTLSSDPVAGNQHSIPENRALTKEAIDARRLFIHQVPGDGPVRGVAVFRNTVYAARDSFDGLTGEIYKSTGAGWVLVKDKLLPGGTYQFEVANFSGDSQASALYGVDGRNPPFKLDGVTFTQFGPIFGTQGTSISAQNGGTGTRTFEITEPTRAWQVGDILIAYPKGKGGVRLTGAVTSYTGSTLVMEVDTSVGSTGSFSDWIIGQSDFEDQPYLISSHKDHLFLAFPRGQLQTSNVGDPLTYTSTASLFGVGEEITGITALKGSVFGIFCDNKVSLLEGSNKLDWQLSQHAKDIGTKLYTLQESGGNALMLGTRGFTSLQATQSFGGFEPSIFSRDVKPMLDAITPNVLFTRMVRGKYQYRIYFKDKKVVTATILTPNPVIAPKDVSFTAQEYEHQPTCVGSGIIDGEDAMFFGTEDGYVMHEDVGNSFDGSVIDAVIRLHFNHLKNPASKKRYHKLTLELESREAANINFRQIFDYSDGQYPVSINRSAITEDLGGQWNVDAWNTFAWSLPITTQAEANIDGVSRNMSLLMWTQSDFNSPVVLQGMLLQYSILGLTR